MEGEQVSAVRYLTMELMKEGQSWYTLRSWKKQAETTEIYISKFHDAVYGHGDEKEDVEGASDDDESEEDEDLEDWDAQFSTEPGAEGAEFQDAILVS
jgi:hypothetical protein